jgi:hypothetical protein
MTQAQVYRLELLEKIAVLNDPSKLLKLKTFVEQEIDEVQVPTDEELLKFAAKGLAQVEEGKYITHKEFTDRMNKAKERGLRKRGA